MTRTLHAALFVLLLSTFFSASAPAATRTAASCSTSDVQTAINSAVGGDTVTIPACSQTNWSSTLTITKGITLQGAGDTGGSQTILGDNVDKGGAGCSGGGPIIDWNVNAPNSFRMTGIKIVGVMTDPGVCSRGHITVHGSTHSMRIDHVTVNPAQTTSMVIEGDIWGVIDHYTMSGAFKYGIRVEHLNWNGTSNDSWGDRSWATAINYGSGEGIYIEDSSFTNTDATFISGAVDCFSGGRLVFRHNTVSMMNTQAHGADSDQRHRACRWKEVYSNTFTYSNVNNLAFIDWTRGGTSVIYNNTITAAGYTNKIVQVVNCRDATAGCGGGPNYTPWGTCNGGSPYDQNSGGGRRCVDQPGSGTSNLLGPDSGGGVTPANTWVGNIPDPIYVWGNTLNGSSNNTTSGSTNVIVNGDYYVGGTGRPGYAPYAYPHPLTGSSDSQPPTVPQNLTASAVSSSAINLSWTASTDNVGVTGYTIYRGGVQVGTSTTNSYVVAGLTASTQYTYTVDAFDAAGNHSAQSTSASATTAAQTVDSQPPTVLQNLTASAASSSAISLSWTASTDNVGVTGYTIYRGGVQVGTSSTNSYMDTGLAASTQYTYTVDAFDAAGNHSAQSTSASATTAAQTAAGTPTLVQHVATGMDRYPVTNFKIPLPNPAGAGNALILGIQFHSSGSISSVADDRGNTWVAGPTVTNSNASQRMSLYYALNVIGGTQKITVTFSGLGSTNAYPQAVVSEFYNVAEVSAADGSSGSATSRSAGAITTTAAGDLIYHWGVDFSDTNVNGGAYNGSGITAGAGFTLLSADLQVGSADQYQVQSSAGSVNATFTATGAATWGSLALALKSASAGTPPPPGIRIVHIQHTLLNSVRAQGRANPVVMQFPSSGNLLVGLFNSADALVSSVSDSAHNTWVSAGSTTGGGGNVAAQIMYAANAATGPTLSGITVALNGTTQGDDVFNLYDITGAATSPFDKSNTALGIQNSPGNLTTTTLTPSTANGLVLNVVSIDFHTVNGIVGSNYVLDSVVNALDNDDPANGGTEVSTLDMDNGYAHIYNTTTGAVTFVYTYNQATPGGVQNWGSVAAAFMASGGGGGTGSPTPPTGLQATVH